LEPLLEMGRGIFARQSPDDVLSSPKSVSIDREGGSYRLAFRLPNVGKQEIDVGRKAAELILTAGGYTRVFSLPNVLVDRDVAGAEFADGTLTITFE